MTRWGTGGTRVGGAVAARTCGGARGGGAVGVALRGRLKAGVVCAGGGVTTCWIQVGRAGRLGCKGGEATPRGF